MASNYPDEGRSTGDGGGERARLPFRTPGAGHETPAEARAELRDRETYYAELRHAVQRLGPPVAGSPAAHTDRGENSRDDDRARDEMATRAADTWT